MHSSAKAHGLTHDPKAHRIAVPGNLCQGANTELCLRSVRGRDLASFLITFSTHGTVHPLQIPSGKAWHTRMMGKCLTLLCGQGYAAPSTPGRKKKERSYCSALPRNQNLAP